MTGSECDKISGFLFPHRCGRISSIGCPYCEDKPQRSTYFNDPQHPYQQDRQLYPNFGRYRVQGQEIDIAAIDFTDADGMSLTSPDIDFERDLGAS